MDYPNSQYKHAQAIADVISRYTTKRPFVHMYCGRAHVGFRVKSREKYFYDTDLGLMQLFQKIDEGWIPPLTVSREMYYFLRLYKDDLSPYLSTFIGHAVTWPGDFWGTWRIRYDKNGKSNRNPATEAYRGLLRDIKKLRANTEGGYSFSYGTLIDLDPDVRYTVYIDIPQDARRDSIYEYINATKDRNVYIVAEPERAPFFYKIWRFDTVATVDNLFLLSSVPEDKEND